MFDLIEKLRKLAARKLPSEKEDFTVDDYAGGNVDDAFGMGVEDGEVRLAREVLTVLGAAA